MAGDRHGRPAARLPGVVPAHRRQLGAQPTTGPLAAAARRVARRHASRVGDTTDAVDLVTADEREVVVAALNRLDAMERLVIALRHFEQLTEQEMAEVLDCPRGTVKSRLSRAMARLRAELTMEAFGDG